MSVHVWVQITVSAKTKTEPSLTSTACLIMSAGEKKKKKDHAGHAVGEDTGGFVTF